MATVSNLNVMVTAGVGGFVTNMGKAGKAFSGFTSTLGTFAKVGLGLTAVFGAINSVEGLVGWVKSTVDAIDRLDELSQKTGISTAALSGLGYVAKFSGIEMEELATGINRMQKALASGEDKPIFAALGLDAQSLATMKPEDAFLAIADAISKMQNPADRVAASMALLGKSGANFLPMLMQGKQGITALMEQAKKFGIVIGDEDAAKVAALNDALQTLGSVFQGALNKLIIEAAPLLTALIDKITDFLTSGPGLIGNVTNAFEGSLLAIAAMADWFEVLKAGWYVFQSSVLTGFFAIGKSVAILTKLMIATQQMLPGSLPTPQELKDAVKSFDDYFTDMGDAAVDAGDKAEAAWEAFTNSGNSKKVTTLFQDIRNAANKNAADAVGNRNKPSGNSALQTLMDNLKEQDKIMSKLSETVNEYGLSEEEVTIQKLKSANATQEQIDKARALYQTLTGLKIADQIMEAQKAFGQLGATDTQKKVADAFAAGATPEQAAALQKYLDAIDVFNYKLQNETPFEKLQKNIKQLDAWLLSGAMSWEDYAYSVAKAMGEYDNKVQGGNTKAYTVGSQESQRMIADVQSGMKGFGQEEITKKQLREAQLQTKLLGDLKDKFANPPTPVTFN